MRILSSTLSNRSLSSLLDDDSTSSIGLAFPDLRRSWRSQSSSTVPSIPNDTDAMISSKPLSRRSSCPTAMSMLNAKPTNPSIPENGNYDNAMISSKPLSRRSSCPTEMSMLNAMPTNSSIPENGNYDNANPIIARGEITSRRFSLSSWQRKNSDDYDNRSVKTTEIKDPSSWIIHKNTGNTKVKRSISDGTSKISSTIGAFNEMFNNASSIMLHQKYIRYDNRQLQTSSTDIASSEDDPSTTSDNSFTLSCYDHETTDYSTIINEPIESSSKSKDADTQLRLSDDDNHETADYSIIIDEPIESNSKCKDADTQLRVSDDDNHETTDYSIIIDEPIESSSKSKDETTDYRTIIDEPIESNSSGKDADTQLCVSDDGNHNDEDDGNTREKNETSVSSTIKSGTAVITSFTVPKPGDSLKADPLGTFSADVPFDQIYKFGDLINAGEFGTVYKAHHVFLNESALVAIKVVDKSEIGAFEEDILRETAILNDIRDVSDVTTLFDFYVEDEKMYIVQELAAGGDVFDRLLEKKTYTESDARDLAKTLLSTIQSLHDRKLVHRDLKPENLLLKNTQSDSSILLCDFGCAKYFEDDCGLWTYVGTPEFVAPEIVDGVEYWSEVDMWSVGCIIYMLLYGHPPFQGSNAEMYIDISSCAWTFDNEDDKSNKVSSEARNLISNLIVLGRSQRLTAKEALECDWFKKCLKEKLDLTDLKESVMDGIKDYRGNDRCCSVSKYRSIDETYSGKEDHNYIPSTNEVDADDSNKHEIDSQNQKQEKTSAAAAASLPPAEPPLPSEPSEPQSTKSSSQSPSTSSPKKKAKTTAAGFTIPKPGDSLKAEPLGTFSVDVTFDQIYKIGDLISEGAFGTVYKAHHAFLNESAKIAIKVVDRSESGEIEQEVVLETSILKDIRGLPNVTTLFDFFVDNEKMYIIQELAAGGDIIDHLLEKETYTESDACDLTKKILLTVQGLHDRKLVHRDLKPENLLLKTMQSNSSIVLHDFGSAKYFEDDCGLRTKVGTPAFTAPEIVAGVEYWAEVDMWSVGCIIYMLLYGHPPFQGENEAELYRCISSCVLAFDDDGDDNDKSNKVSKEAKSLISNLLVLRKRKRFTVRKALECDWFKKCSKEELDLTNLKESVFVGMKDYCDNDRPSSVSRYRIVDENYCGEDDHKYTSSAEKIKEDGACQKRDGRKEEALSGSEVQQDENIQNGEVREFTSPKKRNSFQSTHYDENKTFRDFAVDESSKSLPESKLRKARKSVKKNTAGNAATLPFVTFLEETEDKNEEKAASVAVDDTKTGLVVEEKKRKDKKDKKEKRKKEKQLNRLNQSAPSLLFVEEKKKKKKANKSLDRLVETKKSNESSKSKDETEPISEEIKMVKQQKKKENKEKDTGITISEEINMEKQQKKKENKEKDTKIATSSLASASVEREIELQPLGDRKKKKEKIKKQHSLPVTKEKFSTLEGQHQDNAGTGAKYVIDKKGKKGTKGRRASCSDLVKLQGRRDKD